jgi:hypothetical protein
MRFAELQTLAGLRKLQAEGKSVPVEQAGEKALWCSADAPDGGLRP